MTAHVSHNIPLVKIRRSALRSAFGVFAFCVRHSEIGVLRYAFGVLRLVFGVWRSAFGILHSAFCIRLAQNWSENKASTKQGMVVLALSPPPSWIFLALAPFLRTARIKAEKLFVQERFLHRLLSSFSFLSFYKLTGNTAIEFHSHWDPTTPSHRIDPEISSRQRF